MKFTAEAKNIKVSPRKMRLVVDGIKKMPITTALATLDLSPTSAATPIKKALMSGKLLQTHCIMERLNAHS